jgi:hypothetical protein
MLINIYKLGLILTLVSGQCFDTPSPQLGKQSLRYVDCDNIKTPAMKVKTTTNKQLVGGKTQSNKTRDGMIEIDLTCTTAESTCSMVMDTFVTASDYLTNIIKFNTPIKIQATFTSFCTNMNDCDKVHQTLGQARVTRYHQLRGDDGKVRLYPQALVKQISQTAKKTSFHESDILADFNSDANFYFQSQGGKISNQQSDFLFVVSHELIHGLGFASLYNDYFSESTPTALFPNPQTATYNDGTAKISNFFESVFDKYVVLTSNKRSLSSITEVINGYISSNKDKTFKNEDLAYQNFIDSSQYQVAKDLLQTAQTDGSMEFVFNTTSKIPFNSLVLETNLKPYSPSSSVSHVALKNYQNSKDFLMKYEMSPGSSLSKLVASIGGGNWDTAPYGPGLIAVLETMGYPTNQNPHPNVIAGPANSAKYSKNTPSVLLVSLILTYFYLV